MLQWQDKRPACPTHSAFPSLGKPEYTSRLGFKVLIPSTNVTGCTNTPCENKKKNNRIASMILPP